MTLPNARHTERGAGAVKETPWVKLMHEWKPHVAELGMIIGFYLLYLVTRGAIFSQPDQSGLQNAQRVASLERRVGVFWEPGWQAWTLEYAELLVTILNWVYVVTYWPIILGVGLTLYV
ncbi:MAG: hypothetical protein ACE1Y2_01775, partial [Stenotrophomonas maltophilia]